MYREGVCPDYSYSFSGKPPPTASLIMNYIEKIMVPVIPNKMKVVEKVFKIENDDKNEKSERNEDTERLERYEKEREERIEKSRLKVEQIELEAYLRSEAVHALRVAMNCKSEKQNNGGRNNLNNLSQAENAKR